MAKGVDPGEEVDFYYENGLKVHHEIALDRRFTEDYTIDRTIIKISVKVPFDRFMDQRDLFSENRQES